MNALSSQSRYDLIETNSGYGFITDFGNEYLVTFSDLSSAIDLTGLMVFDFGIEILNRQDAKNDISFGKLRNTIVHLLKQLWTKQPECAILVVLDTTDQKQRARYRMFLSPRHDSWFTLCNEGRIDCISLPLRMPGMENVCFLLVQKDNPRLDDIRTSVAEYIAVSFGESSDSQ